MVVCMPHRPVDTSDKFSTPSWYTGTPYGFCERRVPLVPLVRTTSKEQGPGDPPQVSQSINRDDIGMKSTH